ncbi:MAG: DUF2092 domain-containing protein [Pseudomonadota bacterium]|nr:DUF2092 domain-containing protein [Pseudomonadota bacterium]
MDQLQRMASFMAQLKQFSVEQQSGYDVVQDSGQKIEFGESRELLFVRPDRFREDVRRSDGEETTIAFDGKAITVLNATRKMYASSEMPGSIDAAITHFVKDLKMRLPLAMLFVTILPEELDKRVQEVEMVEIAMLGGTPFYHLAARADSVDFQVWLPTTGDPLPRRIVITYKHEEGQPQYWASFSDWNLSPNPPTSLFTLDIPKDASRIQFLAEIPRAAAPPAAKGEKK